MQFQGVRILELAAGPLGPSLPAPFVSPQVTSPPAKLLPGVGKGFPSITETITKFDISKSHYIHQ